MLVPTEYRINDARNAKELRQTSYHGFKRKDLFKFLISQIKNQNLDNANYWCAECLMSGYCVELYEKLLDYYVTEVNIKNPDILVFMFHQYDRYTELINEYEELIDTRNDQEIRNLLCVIVSIITLSNQFQLPKLQKINQIDITNVPRIRTTFSNYLDLITPFIKNGDAKEIILPMNEILNHLKTPRTNSLDLVIYWLSWLVAWEGEHIKKNEISCCAERQNPKIEKLYWTDMIWILWDILKAESEWKSSANLTEVIDKSYRFYVYYYNRKNRYKKIYLVIYCIMYFLKPIDFINIYGSPENYSKIILAGGNVNSLYKYLETK